MEKLNVCLKNQRQHPKQKSNTEYQSKFKHRIFLMLTQQVRLRANFTQDTSCCFDETEYNEELTHQDKTKLRNICDIINKKFEEYQHNFVMSVSKTR
jgi:hypothetical protein